MKIISIVGARPQFIKAAPLSKKLRKNFKEILVHTGQHYDYGMSKAFFEELKIPQPDYNLGVGSGEQGEQTGKMLIKLEKVLQKEKPALVLVFGDTNSTLAGALAAAKVHIPVGHIEAGMRSFNKDMPEELNRIVADHLSDLLFCSTKTAVDNLKKENIKKGVFLVGDIMYDAFLENLSLTEKSSKILEKLNLKPKNYYLATIHRAENTDNLENLKSIIEAFLLSKEKIIFPVHPRTQKCLKKLNLTSQIKKSNLLIIEPVGYLEMLVLEKNAQKILTDSGGMQKEAYFLKIPCLTLRGETEWVETVEDGWNILVGTNKEKILKAIKSFNPEGESYKYRFGKGKTASKIVEIIKKYQKNKIIK